MMLMGAGAMSLPKAPGQQGSAQLFFLGCCEAAKLRAASPIIVLPQDGRRAGAAGGPGCGG